MPKRKSNETDAERGARLSGERGRKAAKRAQEGENSRKSRLENQQRRTKSNRENETEEDRAQRLQLQCNRSQSNREVETEEDRAQRLQRQRKRVNSNREALRTNNLLSATVEIFEENLFQEHYIGILSKKCDHCGALHFLKEETCNKVYTQCCQNGKIDLSPLTPNDLIQTLLTGSHEKSINFKKYIRSYNAALAFASFGAQIVTPTGVSSLRIHGQIYHQTSNAVPQAGTNPQYAQVYILDSEEAVEQRMSVSANENCDEDLLRELDTMIRQQSPYYEAYKMLMEIETEENNQAALESRLPNKVRMYIVQDGNNDVRRYNAPRSNEVAIVFNSTNGEPPSNRDVCVHPRGGDRIQLSTLDPCRDPMTYPILFPNGDAGFKLGIGQKNSSRNVTHKQFYSYRLSIRDGFNVTLAAGKLTQQYIADAFFNIEGNRTQYITSHQNELRVEMYSGLMDQLQSSRGYNAGQIGRMVILPSSFLGSPRNLQQNYQDAMAIVRKYGKPDLFITMTCNPQWREIVENLKAGEASQDRPDIVNRVFRLKLHAMLNDINTKDIFGKVTAMIYVIEFQKRGLPHAHILIILDEETKIRNREDIDKYVSAELPNAITHPRLFSIVTKSMIHGPCGDFNPKCVCMDAKNNRCTKGYPKAFENVTRMNDDGYPVYRRRLDENTAMVRGHQIDNRWVVPHNRFLLLKYNTHINVEVCSTVKAVKYLFKYIYKGHDCANVILEGEQGNNVIYDEVKMFLDARYVSSTEAMWRILGFEMHSQSHSIYRLAVHLDNEQPVYFAEGGEKQALERAANRFTTLTAWFDINKTDDLAATLLYSDMQDHFVFNKKNTTWTRRKQGFGTVISRMCSVSPNDIERFYVRILLLHVRGATSFDDLRTVDGKIYPTYKEAARKLNLLEDDSEWSNCLRECGQFQMPKQLRALFGFILSQCSPADPLQLWIDFKDLVCEDYYRVYSIEISEQLCLQEIDNVLKQYSLSCRLLELPIGDYITQENLDPVDETEALEFGQLCPAMLNEEQLQVYKLIMRAVLDDNICQRCFYLDGPGGSGKTFCYNTILTKLREKKIGFVSMAWTGIAATLLKEGKTCHCQLGLPVPVLDTSTSLIALGNANPKAVLLRKAKLLIWDEVTMAPSDALRIADHLLRTLMNTETPFGGKVILVGGDWRQCLPVVKHGCRTKILQNCIRSSPLWPIFQPLQLNVNMRAGTNEQVFAKWLLTVGNGLSTESRPGAVEIPKRCMIDGGVKELVDSVFENLLHNNMFAEIGKRVILAPKNKSVDRINDMVMLKLATSEKYYPSVDSVICDNPAEASNYPMEFLNSLTPSGFPPHRLILKVGVVVMLIRNLDQMNGLCNGLRLIVKRLLIHALECEILTGKRKGEHVFIPRIKMLQSDMDSPFRLKRLQFPIKISFAMSINKAQGQTFEKVGIYLPEPVFAHGQLYVALSRVKNFDSLKVLIPGHHSDAPNENGVLTRNIVYTEIL